MKKILFILLALLISKTSYATAPDISAECACVIEANSGVLLYKKNENIRHAMASTTKIMTAIVALENSSPDEIVTVSANAAGTEGSSIYIEPGENIKVSDLIYGLMLNSGNDASIAIAEHISGSSDTFCELMNNKAKEIGALDTNFKNPNGLFEDGHYTTASDLAKITQYALKNDTFKKIVSTRNESADIVGTGRKLYFKNHNKLLWNYEGAIGVKTGYTRDTGRCLVSAATRDGCTLIAVTLDAPSDWNDHKKLLDYGFSVVEPRIVLEENQVLKSVKINDRYYDFVAERSCTVFMKKEHSGAILTVNIPENISAPINKGEKVGTVTVSYGNSFSDTINIISKEPIYKTEEKKISFWDKIINFLKNILHK